MANVFAPFGFSQRAGLGSVPTYEQFAINVDYNTANIFWGDPVFRLSADGTVAGITTGPGPGTTPIAGIFVGCEYLSVSQKKKVWSNYWPGTDVASGNIVQGYIINDPNARFTAQCGGSTTISITPAQYGLNVQFAYGTGNVANGISGAYIDMTVTPATTATLPFRVYSLVSNPPGANGTSSPGAYSYAIVGFNNVETKTLTAV